jgi:hypothetical protein
MLTAPVSDFGVLLVTETVGGRRDLLAAPFGRRARDILLFAHPRRRRHVEVARQIADLGSRPVQVRVDGVGGFRAHLPDASAKLTQNVAVAAKVLKSDHQPPLSRVHFLCLPQIL